MVHRTMISHFSMRWLTILLTSFLSIAHAQDLVRSGNYQILFCGAGTSNSKASQLQASLPNVLNNLKAVLADVKLGTKSTHGFAAFFKSDDSIPTVQKVFQTIIDGAAVGIDKTYPIIACTGPSVDLTRKAHADCLQSETNPFTPWPQYGVIFICPHFWDMLTIPFHSACPTVSSNNALVPGSEELTSNQDDALVHALVHLYGPGLTSMASESNEVDDVQGAVNLNAKASLANANNYALYAAGKSSSQRPEALGMGELTKMQRSVQTVRSSLPCLRGNDGVDIEN